MSLHRVAFHQDLIILREMQNDIVIYASLTRTGECSGDVEFAYRPRLKPKVAKSCNEQSLAPARAKTGADTKPTALAAYALRNVHHSHVSIISGSRWLPNPPAHNNKNI